jgi:gliding motility-associated-like protein
LRLKIIVAHIIFWLTCLFYGYSFAQKPPDILSSNGHFMINYIKGCAPLEVTVENSYTGQIDGIDSYSFNFNPAQPNTGFVANKVHVYHQPGTYVVAQAITALENGVKVEKRDFITVEVFPPTAPEFILVPCANHRATVVIEESIYDRYRIYFSQNDFIFGIYQEIAAGQVPPIFDYGVPTTNDVIRVQGLFDDKGTHASCGSTTQNSVNTIAQINPPNLRGVEVLNSDAEAGEVRLTFTPQEHVYYKLEVAEGSSGNFEEYSVFTSNSRPMVQNLDTENKYYCFRITPLDGCNTGLPSSNVICSMVLDVTAGSNENILTWNTDNETSAMLRYFDVYLDNVHVGDASHPANSFTDRDNITCGQLYCYQVRATNGTQFSYSAVQCVEGNKVYTPPALDYVIASYNNQGGLELSWQPPVNVDVTEYLIARTDNGQTWTSNAPSLQIAGSGNPVCYQLNYVDECGNQSEGATACPIFLTQVSESGLNRIAWTGYLGWQSGIDRYIIEKRDEDGNLIEQIPLPAFVNDYMEPAGQAHQVVYYTVVAVTNDAQPRHITSNQLRVVYEATFYFPNAFTPDGDGINDLFKVIGQFSREYNLVIYSRWGELVFATTDPAEGWDGTYNNKPAPQGTYVYSAVIVDAEGNKHQRRGTVQLLRR